MAFCGKCGAKLEGDERFCASCGADVTAAAASPAASAAAPAPASAPPAPVPSPPVPSRPVAPAQPAGVPVPYPAQGPFPGQVPIVMGMPPQAQPKRGWMWLVVIVVILVGLYYIGKRNPQPTAQQPAPGQQPAPAQPGQQPTQGQQPAPAQPIAPGVNPDQQPGVPGQSGNNADLVRMQLFGGRWDGVNGSVQISQARWTNNANVIIQAATLECVQYAANGGVLTQNQTTLNGPVQPQSTSYFGVFQMGSMAPNLAKVNCGIVGVRPAGQ